MRGEETLMWLDGTECELRPVSAAAFFDAKHESNILAGRYGEDAESRYILQSACLVAAGAYSDGEKKFSSGEDVLQKLSAKEIVSAGSEYMVTQIRKEGGEGEENADPVFTSRDVETGEQETYRVKTENDASDIEVPAAQKSYEPGIFESRSEIIPDYDEPSSAKKQPIYEETPAAGAKRVTELFSAAEETTDSQYPETITVESRPAGNGLQDISDYFERDCRRYDGAFERF